MLRIWILEQKFEFYLLCLSPVGSTGQSTASDGCKIDTNVFMVKFSCLSEPKPVHTGDPVICSNQACTAVLNHLSHIIEESRKVVGGCR